jgi:hypothetical protein
MNDHRTEKLLANARTALEPTQEDRERVHKKVTAAIGAAGVISAASGTAAKATGGGSTAATFSGTTLVKIGVGILMLGGLATAVGALVPWSDSRETSTILGSDSPRREDTISSPSEVSAVSETPEATSTLPPFLPSKTSDTETPQATPNIGETPAHRALKGPSPSERRPILAEGGTPKDTPDDTFLLRELSLIRAAASAHRDGQPEEVLRVLSIYDNEFPRGAMRQERDALRVLALCDLGRRHEAKKARERFLKQFPHSPMAARIRNNCQESEE